MDLGLKDRVVLVTGGSRGIGRAVARLFGRECSRVAFTYHERCEAAHDLAKEISADGSRALALIFDLASNDSIQAAVNEVLAQWGRIDVLVNNAVATKIHPRGPVSEWQALVRANIEGNYHTTQAVVASMRANRWGRIVNVSSTLAVDGMPGFSWYTTAKSALHGMTLTCSQELGPFGILVNAVMAGLTATEEQPIQLSQRHYENAAAGLPIRRVPTPDEVARMILFLGSGANTVTTGETIRVSGGTPC